MSQQARYSIESLEARRFLDASAALSDFGVFQVTGTDEADAIEVSLSDDGTKVQATLGGTLLGEADVEDVRFVRITALGGDDTVTVADELDLHLAVLGGDGNDTITVAGQANISGGAGNDTITVTSVAADDSTDESTTDDGATDEATDDARPHFHHGPRFFGGMISGGEGDDIITLADGDYRVSGGDGNDTITAGVGSIFINAGAGNDTVASGTGGEGTARVFGADGDDTITFDGESSALFGGDGADTITGGLGDDTIYGGDGEDSLAGGSGGTDSVNEDSPTIDDVLPGFSHRFGGPRFGPGGGGGFGGGGFGGAGSGPRGGF